MKTEMSTKPETQGERAKWTLERFDDLGRIKDASGKTIATVYDCEAVAIVKAHNAPLLEADGKAGGEVVALRQENELLRTALRFYANGDNYHLDESEDFDTVSGEPQSWLCSGAEDSETMVENGEVARYTLMGHVIGWEDAEEDHTPQPIAGEAPFSAAALQTAYNTRPQQAAQVAQPLTDCGVLDIADSGKQSLQLIFKSREAADLFRLRHWKDKTS